MASTEHDHLKEAAKLFFEKAGTVECPAFPKEEIIFNSKGCEHLFYKGSRKARKPKQSKMRISLLPSALIILKKLSLFQEERILSDNKGRTIHYWAFEGVVEERRIKVIVRQVGKGKKHFWSVIPSWKNFDGKRVNIKSKFWKE
mgnify:FL=1